MLAPPRAGEAFAGVATVPRKEPSMYRNEMNARSPMRILEQSIHGGLGPGHLGAIMAPAGVGKSAILVQIGLDDLMRGRSVLHIAIDQPVEHVAAWYDALFDDLAKLAGLADRGEVRESIGRRLVIEAFAAGDFGAPVLDAALATLETHLRTQPSAILIDGFRWEGPGCTAALGAIKASAARVGAELWMTARTADGYAAVQARKLAPLCEGCAALVDVGLFLDPHGSHVKLRLVKDHDQFPDTDVHLELHSEALRLVEDGEPSAAVERPPRSFTLLATGSSGAEAEFGACAERWGVREMNFTFSGREELARIRGLVELSEDELVLGQVSMAYVRAQMHRTYPDTAAFKRVLQAIWHQVSTAGEVFCVGAIMPDKTAHGGTGWAVELARHWGKPVHLFDQERRCWFVWRDRDWVEEPPPTITRDTFAGTGTRSLSEDGRAAIRTLFERSFGSPPPN
jgi:hypothetical protein